LSNGSDRYQGIAIEQQGLGPRINPIVLQVLAPVSWAFYRKIGACGE